MNLLNLQLSALLVLDPLSVILPFLWIFRLEWRYDAHRIAGILLGYLFIICGLFLFFLRLLPGFSRHGLIWSLRLMAFSLSLCLLLTKVKIQAAAYTLFLFKNVSDSASLLSRFLTVLITSHNPSIPHTACVRSLELLLIPAAVLIITAVIGTRLRQAVYYTRFLPVWRRMLLIPAFFFLMYYMDMGLIYMPELRPDDYNYNVLLITLFWLICVYTVHITTLQILFLITQSFALKEEYRTMKIVSDALTSQTANLQINLEQPLKARHDFRHHLAILKGLLGQKEYTAASDYLESYLGSQESCDTYTYCSNAPVNALLNYYLQTAREHSVNVTANVCLPAALPMPDMDFCTILGNLLSNALEACLRQEGGIPAISVTINSVGQSMITLSIRNSYSHEIKEQDGQFISSKRDGIGIGTSSVRYLTERYHGFLNFSHGNGIFEASVFLNPSMDRAAP